MHFIYNIFWLYIWTVRFIKNIFSMLITRRYFCGGLFVIWIPLNFPTRQWIFSSILVFTVFPESWMEYIAFCFPYEACILLVIYSEIFSLYFRIQSSIVRFIKNIFWMLVAKRYFYITEWLHFTFVNATLWMS